jgi:hypothetical protein
MHLRIPLVFVAGLATQAALASEEISLPQVHVRDSWKYSKVDGFTGEVTDGYTVSAVEVGGSGITVRVDRPSPTGAKHVLLYYDNSWNIEDNAAAIFEPSLSVFRFPLVSGAHWNADFRVANRKTDTHFSCSVKAEAIGRENVSVAAGTFDAMRIEADNSCRSVDANANTWLSHYSYWYAPAVNRFVKSVYTQTSDGRVREKWSEELTEYRSAN